jgi:hypothetical protein
LAERNGPYPQARDRIPPSGGCPTSLHMMLDWNEWRKQVLATIGEMEA